MADFEENAEEMVETTREAADGDETGGPGDETGDKTAATAGNNETAATGGVMYTDEEELEFDEDEIAALEGQR